MPRAIPSLPIFLSFFVLAAAAGAVDRGSLPQVRGTAVQPALSPGCAAGTVYDNGSFESATTLAGEPVLDLVTRFELVPGQQRLEQVCLCWTRTGGDGTADFDLLAYAADGPGGQPGTLLTGLAGVEITGIPLFPQTAFYNLDLSALGIDLPGDRVYLGATWDAEQRPDVALCGDDDSPAPRPAYASTDQGQSWTPLATFFPTLAVLGVRADFGDGSGGGGFTCVADPTTLCLHQGRFQARLSWSARSDGGQARVVPAASDGSGLFYFRRQDNWEMLLKVLNGCPLNGHFWVFFAAVTNVEYTLTVVDSQNGSSREYRNPLGVSSPAVTDTEAFATCPP